jgi:hypothetical protein
MARQDHDSIIQLTDMKNNLKEIAIDLRTQGFSYREIMQQIPVAKSTISDWLHSVQLAQHQKQRLTEKRIAARGKGGKAWHEQKIFLINEIIETAKEEIDSISYRELWLIGIMLYWAEGSKEKKYRRGCYMKFTNSDPGMIRIFLCWLRYICGKELDDLHFSIYIHETHRCRKEEIIEFWSKSTNVDEARLQQIYYKKGNPKTIRKNIGEDYYGIFVIYIKNSSSLLRTIAGWTQGVVESIR